MSKDQFKLEINQFKAKYSNNWELLYKNSMKDSHSYLKTTIHESNLITDAYIVYSDSYQVPVLYFLPTVQTDDSSHFASLDELKPFLTADPGSIAFAENPINGIVMYNVHPCLTAEFMNEILNSVKGSNKGENSPNYIECWLSFCPFVPVIKTLKTLNK